ncbi:purine nucleoside phosphorylase inosine and guanosine-specific [Nannochloropsis gaditana]|uniref:purine-nucleoside phosphorylase n=1 Tax=Nannochloropsis gaditana TaxID=72520 RepID=W7TMD9_9STRA|nr:purine nucleoside phosphorylase inosine and guanosine-specific [Nannochloropsis gaditana]
MDVQDNFRPVREKIYRLEDARKVADFLRSRSSHPAPEIAIVLGSRLHAFEQVIEAPEKIYYHDIQAVLPSFPTCSTAIGKEGAFIFGSVDGISVLVMQGRFHMYEGHSSQATAFPVRVIKELGVQTLILTNAARGLSPTLEIGDVMLVVDHYNTERGSETHPLAGINVEHWGPRFLRCDNLYDYNLRRMTRQIAKEKRITLKQGGYIFVSGPSYETPMEEDGLRNLCEKRRGWGRLLMHVRHWLSPRDSAARDHPGGLVDRLDRILNHFGMHDTAVGMSTVPEVLVAEHCGLKVLVLSGIYHVTQENTVKLTAIPHYEYKTHKRVAFEMTRRREEEYRQSQVAPKMTALLRGLLRALGDTSDIAMDYDVAEIARWRFPTTLCVSWHRLILGSTSVALALGLLVTALEEQRRRR